jgi:hypothetical protein
MACRLHEILPADACCVRPNPPVPMVVGGIWGCTDLPAVAFTAGDEGKQGMRTGRRAGNFVISLDFELVTPRARAMGATCWVVVRR